MYYSRFCEVYKGEGNSRPQIPQHRSNICDILSNISIPRQFQSSKRAARTSDCPSHLSKQSREDIIQQTRLSLKSKSQNIRLTP